MMIFVMAALVFDSQWTLATESRQVPPPAEPTPHCLVVTETPETWRAMAHTIEDAGPSDIGSQGFVQKLRERLVKTPVHLIRCFRADEHSTFRSLVGLLLVTHHLELLVSYAGGTIALASGAPATATGLFASQFADYLCFTASGLFAIWPRFRRGWSKIQREWFEPLVGCLLDRGLLATRAVLGHSEISARERILRHPGMTVTEASDAGWTYSLQSEGQKVLEFTAHPIRILGHLKTGLSISQITIEWSALMKLSSSEVDGIGKALGWNLGGLVLELGQLQVTSHIEKRPYILNVQNLDTEGVTTLVFRGNAITVAPTRAVGGEECERSLGN